MAFSRTNTVTDSVGVQTHKQATLWLDDDLDNLITWINARIGNFDTTWASTTKFLDEDDMASDSAVSVPSQQSVKAYVDTTDAKVFEGDGTAGRVLRLSQLKLDDGTDASTLKCTLTNVWNGNSISEVDNVAKGATTGTYWTLDAGGQELTIEASGLTGNAVAAVGIMQYNTGGTAADVDCDASGNDLVLSLRNTTSATQLDMTGLVDNGVIYVNILYITDD